MLIAIDYDDTYTADPALWATFIGSARASGHEVVCVTARESKPDPTKEPALPPGLDVICTSGQDKAPFCASVEVWPDVWIDDRPHLIGRFF